MSRINSISCRAPRTRWWKQAFMLGAWMVGSAASAQVLFTETFTGGAPVAGFTNVQNVGSTAWVYNNPGARSVVGVGFDADFAIFDSDNAGSGGGAANASLTSASFDASVAGVYQLSFDQLFRSGYGSFALVEVFNGSVWNTVITQTTDVGNPTPITTSLDITAATGGSAVAQVRFTYDGDWAWYWALDNIGLERLPPPSCVVPIVSTSNITSGGVDVSWTCASCTGTYIVEYGAPGFVPGTDATAGAGTIWTGAPVAGSPVSITGLSALTGYQVYVRQECTAGVLYSANSAVQSFTTACAGSTCDYVVRFGDIFGDTWDGTEWVMKQNGTVLLTFGPQLTGSCNGGTGYIDIPVTVCEGASIELEWTVLGGFTGEKAVQLFDPFGVLLYDFRGTSTSTNCPTINWTSANNTPALGVQYTTTANCTPPACVTPLAVAATNVTYTGADITWTCAGCPGTFIVEYGAPGFTPGTADLPGVGGTIVTSASSPAALSLSASTSYQVYVRQECTPFSLYSGNSSPISFTTPCAPVVAPIAEDFEGTAGGGSSVPPTCWSNSGPENWLFQNSGGFGPDYGVAGAIDHSSGSGIYAWVDGSGDIQANALTSPLIDISGLTSPAVSFWMLSNNVNDAAVNVLRLEAWDGLSWTLVNSYSGNDPAWQERLAILSGLPSITQIRFVLTGSPVGSQFYNDILIDDISVIEAPTCLVPTGLAQTAVSPTALSASWTLEPNAGSYNVEVRTSGAAGSGPAGLVEAATVGTNSFSTSVLLSASTNYQVYVQSDCTGNGDGLSLSWAGPLNVFTGYCIPVTDGNLDVNGITNVTFANVNQNMNTEADLGYTDNSATVAAIGSAGGVVPFSVTVETGFTYDMSIWIDWNNNLIFDVPSELVAGGVGSEAGGTAGTPWVSSFTVPALQPSGEYRMRIGGADFGLTGPCFNGAWMAFTDFTVSVCAPPTDNGTAVVDDCIGQTFEVSVTVDLGAALSGAVDYSVNGVAQTQLPYTPGMLIGPFASHEVVDVTVVTNQGCSIDLGRFRSACDIELDCNAPSPIQMIHCYDNGDTQTWTWVNTEVGGTVALKFLSGTMDSNDNVLFWEGAVGGTPATPPTTTGTLTGFTITSVGNTLSMSITTDGSNSCADGGQAAGWVFQARCGGCAEPLGSIVTDVGLVGLPEEVDCNASPDPTFNAYVAIFDNGIDENTASSPATVGYRLFVNNVAQPDVTGLAGALDAATGTGSDNPYFLGAFPLGTDLDLILLHEDQINQSSCNSQVATDFTVGFELCPPANDLCENAEVLTLNPDGTCPANSVTGTTRGADQTGALPECQASGTAQDVWYTFNSGVATSFTMTLEAGTADNVGVQLFTACGTPAPGACLYDLAAPGLITVTVAAGTDYWLRVFTDVSAGPAGTFNICVSAFDPCVDILPITGCDVSVQTTRPAGVGAWNGLGGPFATPGKERVFTFTPTLTGVHNLNVTNVTGSWVDFYFKPSSAGCNSVGWTYINDYIGTGDNVAGATMTAGIEYYIMWDAEDQTTARDVTFSVSCPLLPPANDNCGGAIALTVNGTTACTVQTSGTIGGATASSEVAVTCGTANDDVWYSFVATAASHTVALNNVSGFQDMAFTVSSGSCGALTQVVCSDPNTTTLTGLSIGATYYVRVYTWGSTAGLTTTFDVCVSTPPVPGSECNGAIAIGTFPVVNQAMVCSGAALPGLLNSSNVPTTCGGASTSYMGGDEGLYTFTPATTGSYIISYSGQTWTGIFVYANACPTNAGTCVGSIGSSTAAKSLVVSLTAGVTYYIWFDTFPTPNSPCPGTFSLDFAPAPPANDNCGGAIALTVNPNYACGSVTPGTVAFATASPENAVSCSGTEDDDVWFSFVATNTTHRIDLINVAGSTTDLFHSLWTGGCGSLTLVPGTCSDPNTSNPTGLTIGATYYLRVYTWTATGGQTSTFDVCIGTPPPPPANDDCAGAVNLTVNPGLTCGAQTAGTLQSATNSGIAVAPCTGVVNDDVWYRFTATSTQHTITLSSVAPATTMRMQLFSGACGSLVHLSCATIDGYTTPNTLTIGQQYYVRVYSSAGTAVGTTFNICVTTPPVGPPANDECAGATSIGVSSGITCTTATTGTVFGATASGLAVAPCAGTADDDVWYSFVATANRHIVSLSNIVGSSTTMNMGVFSGACGSLVNVGCGTGTAAADILGMTVGATYYVRVYTNTAVIGQNTVFNICVTTPPTPANDLCANAIAVSCNSVSTGTTAFGTNTGRPTGSCSDLAINDTYVDNAAAGVWYTVQGWGGPMVASLCGSSFDTQVGVFSGSCGAFTCVAGNDDAFGFCSPQSRASWNSTLGTTYYVYVTAWAAATTGTYTLSISCGNTGACASGGNALNLEFQNDANPGQVTWSLLNSAGNLTVLSGADPIPANQIGTLAMCVPDGCYQLRVNDSAGDGMTTGGYELRLAEAIPEPRRIIDNTNNFSTGSVSQIANGLGFCLPMGVSKPIYSSCDKLDWVTNKFIVATEDPLVSAQYNVTNTTSGYVFWFFDPNGSYSFRRFRSHATSDGYGTGATRANHFRLNAWTNTPSSPHLPEGVLLNVRIRSRIAGVNQEWGPACQFKMDAALAACPLVNLQDNPANVNDYSCGVNRNWGGSNQGSNKIVADPPQFFPAVPGGSTRYQFRFRNSERCIVLPPQTSATRYLNWNVGVAEPLVVTETYEVDVRVSKDGGATWCTGLASTDASSNCADLTPWGKICLVTITGSNAAQGGSSSMALEGGNLTMYPNPNRGDQVRIALSEVAADVNTVSVDIYDMTGKRVSARTIAVQDGYLNTVLELNGDLAGGLYMVNITAGDKTYTERLVIQP